MKHKTVAVDVHLGIVLAVAGLARSCLPGEQSPVGPAPISDARILATLYRPHDIRLARDYFTPEAKAAFLREASVPRGPGGRPVRWPFFHGVYRGQLVAPKAYHIGENAWQAALPDAPQTPYRGSCPFCGRPFKGVDANMDAAHTATTRCCKKIIYSRAADIPKGDPVQPDREVSVSLRDGRTVSYPAYTAAKGKVFLPAGVIAAEIYPRVVNMVVPPLVNRVVVKGDVAAAKQLVAILDRMAQVAAKLPFAKRGDALAFARYRDIPSMLPPGYEELAATFRERPADAFISGPDYERLVTGLSAGPVVSLSGRDRAYVPGFLAARAHWAAAVEAWGIMAQHPAVATLSQELYRDADAIAGRIRQMIAEINAHFRFDPCPGGNFAIGWFPFHVALAVTCQDRRQAEVVVERMESFLVNHHFSEGISHEGAFNYAAMMGSCFEPWISKTFFGVDFAARYPWLDRLHQLGDYPVRTLANIESMHADEHNAFFSSARLYPPEAFDYAGHERSQCFAEYGLTSLRAGSPGSRLELIMTHQNPTMHTDPDRLGLQLFYEGVSLLPDIGYMTYRTDMSAVRRSIEKSQLRIGQVPEKGRYGYNDTVENHCTAAVNGNQFDLRCTTFERYFGGMPAGDARWLVQFAQVDGRPVFAEHVEPVQVYNRQVATINLPDGQPIVFDVFRIKGGRRHDLFWHVPAEPPETSLGPPKALPESSLHQYYTAHANPVPGWRKEEDPFSRFYAQRKWRYKDDTLELLAKPTAWDPKPAAVWQTTWTIDPERYAPTLKSGPNEKWNQWGRLLKPVRLRIWGTFGGAPARDRVLGAVGPWCSLYQGFGGLQFEEALSYWIEHRQGTKDLASAFVHVIEPYAVAQEAAVRSVEALGSESPDAIDGRAVRVRTHSGDIVYVASTLNAGSFHSDRLELHGRMGVLMPSARSAFLYDGTALRADDMAVELDDSWRLRLLGVRGDLTGDLAESALFVESDRRLPTEGILTGTMITVRHQTNAAHTSGYRIRKVTALVGKIYRIDLEGNPGFIQYKYRVADWSADEPQTVVADKINLVAPNQPYLIGRRIRFPRSGFETGVAATGAKGWRAYHHNTWYLAEKPAAGQIRKGDPMIVYATQAGDIVEIPSCFSCRSDRIALRVATTGRSTLTLNGRLDPAEMPPGVEHSYQAAKELTILRLAPGTHRLSYQLKPISKEQ